jgi:hypothetical protein
MRTISSILALVLLIAFASCSGDSSSKASTAEKESPTIDTVVEENQQRVAYFNVQTDCDFRQEIPILENNLFEEQSMGIYILIKADSATLDEQYGFSQRILEVYDTNCTRLAREILPINKSPDFPYFLAQKTYNRESHLIAIRGFNDVYLYNLITQRMYPRLIPAFRTARELTDAQSGMIEHIELWEDHLIGYARDFGGFVFDLRPTEGPRPVLPIAEYQNEQGKINTLFLLPSTGGYQFIMPGYEAEEKALRINPVLSKPMPYDISKARQSQSGKLFTFKPANRQLNTVVIDMDKGARVSPSAAN